MRPLRALAAFALAVAAAAPAAAAGRPGELQELRARHVVAPDAKSWTDDDADLLGRMRRAERLGALDYLRDETGTLAGSAVEIPSGEGFKRTVLTAEGYQRWLFMLSQDARRFFERHGAQAWDVFRVKDSSGTHLFDGDGLLTTAGVDLFLTARARRPVFWRDPDGRLNGTVRPPQESAPEAPAAVPPLSAPPPAPAVEPGEMPPGTDLTPAPRGGDAATSAIAGLLRAGAAEVTLPEAEALAKSEGMTADQLRGADRLKAVPFRGKVRYFLRPGDPLLDKLPALRAPAR